MTFPNDHEPDRQSVPNMYDLALDDGGGSGIDRQSKLQGYDAGASDASNTADHLWNEFFYGHFHNASIPSINPGTHIPPCDSSEVYASSLQQFSDSFHALNVQNQSCYLSDSLFSDHRHSIPCLFPTTNSVNTAQDASQYHQWPLLRPLISDHCIQGLEYRLEFNSSVATSSSNGYESQWNHNFPPAASNGRHHPLRSHPGKIPSGEMEINAFHGSALPSEICHSAGSLALASVVQDEPYGLPWVPLENSSSLTDLQMTFTHPQPYSHSDPSLPGAPIPTEAASITQTSSVSSSLDPTSLHLQRVEATMSFPQGRPLDRHILQNEVPSMKQGGVDWGTSSVTFQLPNGDIFSQDRGSSSQDNLSETESSRRLNAYTLVPNHTHAPESKRQRKNEQCRVRVLQYGEIHDVPLVLHPWFHNRVRCDAIPQEFYKSMVKEVDDIIFCAVRGCIYELKIGQGRRPAVNVQHLNRHLNHKPLYCLKCKKGYGRKEDHKHPHPLIFAASLHQNPYIRPPKQRSISHRVSGSDTSHIIRV